MSDALRTAAEQLIDPQGRELAKAVRWLELDLPGLDPALRWPVAVLGEGQPVLLLHGEKVGFGILVQLRLEEQLGGSQLAAQARRQLFSFFRQLQLPVSLEELGLAGASLQELQEVCRFACREGSDLHHLPFQVSPDDLLSALVSSSQGCLTH